MERPENPPAFPTDGRIQHGSAYDGMSLRDWFAGQALVGVGQEYLHRNGFHGDTLHGNLAAHAYRIADAMLQERSRRNG